MSAALPMRMVEKPWGREVLPPPFVAPPRQRIGEVWFEPPPRLPGLLVKYIFTSENLSVQVHPSDAQTEAAGLGSQGKEECWLIIDAEPGARLGMGFRVPITAQAMRRAALDGSIEDLLDWVPVKAGDFFYIPAGTVHAIGAGISLVEVQQNSDVTYRLYDYGRPRELHLEAAVAVARGEVHPAALRRSLTSGGAEQLVDGPLFRLDRLDGPADAATVGRYGSRPLLVVPLLGSVQVDGERIVAASCAAAQNLAKIAVPEGAQYLIAQDCAQAGSVDSIQPPPTTRSPQ